MENFVSNIVRLYVRENIVSNVVGLYIRADRKRMQKCQGLYPKLLESCLNKAARTNSLFRNHFGSSSLESSRPARETHTTLSSDYPCLRTSTMPSFCQFVPQCLTPSLLSMLLSRPSPVMSSLSKVVSNKSHHYVNYFLDGFLIGFWWIFNIQTNTKSIKNQSKS